MVGTCIVITFCSSWLATVATVAALLLNVNFSYSNFLQLQPNLVGFCTLNGFWKSTKKKRNPKGSKRVFSVFVMGRLIFNGIPVHFL
jgi:hypothetical protein